jgi:hypothetical protein
LTLEILESEWKRINSIFQFHESRQRDWKYHFGSRFWA